MYIITTPIPYTNASPHLGHLLEGLYTDTIYKYQKYIKNSNPMLTMGLDQHGLKILQQALLANKTPEIFVEETGKTFTDLWSRFNIEYTQFIPTHSKRHILLSQSIFRTLVKNNHIYKKDYTGLYCVGCEDFYAQSQLTEEGNCPIHLNKPIELAETNYFFRLSNFEQPVLNFLQTVTLKPSNIANEWRSFISQGLKDISCTREAQRLPWGIPVPDDDSQVMYVWIEALLNYCTAIFTQEELEVMTDEDIVNKLRDSFPIDLMYCSKEISKFHLVIFPALLTALDIPLPLSCICHGMINDDNGIKMSKSLGNVITPDQVLELYTIDETRFIFMHEINIFGDSNFGWDNIKSNYNIFLANNLGNIFTRVTTLATKFGYNLSATDCKYDWSKYFESFESGDTKIAFDEIFKACTAGNEYLESTKPWELAKDDNNLPLLKDVLGSSLNLLKEISFYLYPFMPESSEILNQSLEGDIVKIPPMFIRK
jgi:methionyl-tRNA synthetase